MATTAQTTIGDLITAGYIRASDAVQDQDGTLETQRQRIESYAA